MRALELAVSSCAPVPYAALTCIFAVAEVGWGEGGRWQRCGGRGGVGGGRGRERESE